MEIKRAHEYSDEDGITTYEFNVDDYPSITHNSTWVGPNGERPMVPKDDGQTLMVSAFCSREFGFGMPVTQSQLDEFNNERKNKNYRV
jgi:hypothetical protein